MIIKWSIIEGDSSINHFQPYIRLKGLGRKLNQTENYSFLVKTVTEPKPTNFW